jgi:hypothetical protein
MNSHFLKSIVFAVVVLLGAMLAGCQTTRRPNWAAMEPLERDVARNVVSLGMTIPQVKRAWDEKPCDMNKVTNAEGTTETWTYCAVCPETQKWVSQLTTGHREKHAECEKMRQVIFVDGKVIEVRR